MKALRYLGFAVAFAVCFHAGFHVARPVLEHLQEGLGGKAVERLLFYAYCIGSVVGPLLGEFFQLGKKPPRQPWERDIDRLVGHV